MGNQIRSKTPGATFFFTARLADPRSSLLTDEVDLLRRAMRETVSRYPFSIDDIVVLPAAIHTIWTLPEDDADFSTRWSYLKSRFSRALPPPESRTATEILRKEKGIWQRRFWEHRIRSAHDLMLHRRLIHTAPVEAGLVERPTDWSWTSLHRDLATAHMAHSPARAPKFSEMGLKTAPPEKV
ncbi:REP-associated tyrosine transposase [Roseobacter sinensis]|uniref:Transposase n=1 Tax=Roseobacter sinensis TaxID=2931391 RepID=A0ABT3BLD5_9RHOB|nr:transposase [Roseobacter sp. WL0113]MCV3273929.1 transposase [Roseobacter sp. WL0113]